MTHRQLLSGRTHRDPKDSHPQCEGMTWHMTTRSIDGIDAHIRRCLACGAQIATIGARHPWNHVLSPGASVPHQEKELRETISRSMASFLAFAQKIEYLAAGVLRQTPEQFARMMLDHPLVDYKDGISTCLAWNRQPHLSACCLLLDLLDAATDQSADPLPPNPD